MHAFPVYDWAVSIFVGCCVVSYWRCSWVLMDLWTCGQPEDALLAFGNSFCLLVDSTLDPKVAALRVQSASISYGIGMGCLAMGVLIIWMGWWVPHNKQQRVTPMVVLARFTAIYVLGFSGVNVWRGIWYWADEWILPDQPYVSYWTTSIAGSTLCYLLWGGNSLLAPPSVFLLDGPGLASPPVAITLLSSHYDISLPVGEEPPKLSMAAKVADILFSFVLLPFGVVWYWRGSWLLLDYWFWGLTDSDDDVNISLLWTFLLALSLGFLTSEPIVGLIDSRIESQLVLSLFGRLRTYIMAWGTVAFWRLIWIGWDQFIGATQRWAILGHILSVVILTTMGCLSAICAPSSTLGVDSVPNLNAADEPLFSVLPLPHELLYLLGIARQPLARKSSEEIEIGSVPAESEKADNDVNKGGDIPERTSETMDVQQDLLVVTTTEPGPIASVTETGDLTEEKDQVSDMSCPSSRPGLLAQGSNSRSYAQLQREGSDRTKTACAQRPGLENKRSRSKFFRCR